MIERVHLDILKAIHERGTLTLAAKHLHVSQSALSHAINKIEAHYGTSIWKKDGRTIKLTQSGHYLLSMAYRVLPLFDQAEEQLNAFATGKKGLLRIGMECHPCYQWLIQVSKVFIEKFPLVDIDVKQKFQFGGVAALLNSDIDVLVTPDPYPHKHLIATPSFDYELVAVVSAQHPLAKACSLSAKDFESETLITYPVPKERLDIFTQILIPANTHPKHHKIMESTDLMLQFVENNRGITILPDWLVTKYKNDLNISGIRIGKLGIKKSIHTVIRLADQDIFYLNEFLKIAKK